jgi:hypothetical protein
MFGCPISTHSYCFFVSSLFMNNVELRMSKRGTSLLVRYRSQT